METASAAPAPTTQAPSTPAPSAPESKGTVGTQATTAPKTPSEKYELKVNGRTTSLTREELIAKAQLGMSADERFAMAAQKSKEVEGILSQFKDKKTLMKALSDPRLGHMKDDLREVVEQWYTEEFIEPEKMTPEQRRLKEIEKELRSYKEKETTAQKESEAKQMAEMTAKETEHFQASIIGALEKSGLPRTKSVVRKMAFYMHQNLEKGWDAPMELIIEQVKRDRQDDIADIINSSDMDTLESYFGPELFKKLRKHDLTKLRARKAGGVDPEHAVNPRQAGKATDEDHGKISYRDVNKNLRRLMQGK